MWAVVNVVALLVVSVSCAPATQGDVDSEVVYAAGSEPQPATFIPNQYKPAAYPFSQPQFAPVYKRPGVYNPAVYKQPPVYNSPIYKQPPVYNAPIYKQPPVYNAPVYKPPPVYNAPVYQSSPVAPKYQVHEGQQPHWAILRSNLDNNFDGNFQYDFETENGIVANAVGTVRQLGPEEIGQAIQGSYSYTSPDGTPIVTSYIADENGFQVQGDHLPVAPAEPELPPLIAKSVAYILSHPPLPENQQ